MNTSETLYRAADLIEERGWTHGKGWADLDAGGPLCAEGAIAAAMGLDYGVNNHCRATAAVREYVGTLPFLWNDDLFHHRVSAAIARRDPGTLEDKRAVAHAEAAREVVEVLRAAAVVEAARETAVAEVTA